MWLPLVMQGVWKLALRRYCKCYCVASVTKTFTLNLQGVERWIVCTPSSVNVFVTFTTQQHLEQPVYWVSLSLAFHISVPFVLFLFLFILKMEAVCLVETLITTYRTTIEIIAFDSFLVIHYFLSLSNSFDCLSVRHALSCLHNRSSSCKVSPSLREVRLLMAAKHAKAF
jgi:hypothetical protein